MHIEYNSKTMMWALLFLIIIYVILAILAKKQIRKAIKHYLEDASTKIPKLEGFIYANAYNLINLGTIIFPITLAFIIGCSVGKHIYDLLIDNDENNRIASWFA